MPKISVLVPCYNAAKHVREAIDSILGQTFADFELILVDDGSTDEPSEIIQSYTDSRIQLVALPKNQGIATARNTAIQEARGEYLAFLDADDVSRPDRLKIQSDYLDSHSGIGLVDSAYRSLGKMKVWQTPASHSRIAGEMLFKLPFRMSTVMFRKNALQEGNIFLNPAFQVSEDHDFIDQFFAAGNRLANLPDALVDYQHT